MQLLSSMMVAAISRLSWISQTSARM
jgi:hypothetical protein